MNNANGDQPAIPTTVELEKAGYIYLGLTKREYFAAMAMQGLLAQGGYGRFEALASDAVKQADALLEKLEK